MLQENGTMSSVITLAILPSCRVRDGQVDQARGRRVLTGRIFPKHNRLAHIKQELEVQVCLHHHVVAHRVWESTQVIELSIVCHTATHRPVRWTCSHCVPNVVKIALFILHTYRKLRYQLCDYRTHNIWHRQVITQTHTGLLTNQNYTHEEIKSWLNSRNDCYISLPEYHLQT